MASHLVTKNRTFHPFVQTLRSAVSCVDLMMNITPKLIMLSRFKGDWAGNDYATSGCPGTCADRIMDPSNFDVRALVFKTIADSLMPGHLERILDYQLAESLQTAKFDRCYRFRTRCSVREHPVYALVSCVGCLGFVACALCAGVGKLAHSDSCYRDIGVLLSIVVNVHGLDYLDCCHELLRLWDLIHRIHSSDNTLLCVYMNGPGQTCRLQSLTFHNKL